MADAVRDTLFAIVCAVGLNSMHMTDLRVPSKSLCATSIGQFSVFAHSRQMPSILHISITLFCRLLST